MKLRIAVIALFAVAFIPTAGAQFKNGNQTVILNLPRMSPRSMVTQRIGVTDISVTYHRPQANGRKVFGDMVMYGRLWRTGANDNTTIEFPHPVTIEGQVLPAGRYGVFTVPNTSEWTIIFSKASNSWGHFYYDPKEDALRVKVKPLEGTYRDAFTIDFTELKHDTATMELAWERVVVPVHLAVDSKENTLVSLRSELRHLPSYKAEAWFEAALYCVDHEFNYPEALKWVNQAIALNGDSFDNLDLKAQILERSGQREEAAKVQADALKIATPEHMYGYGMRLLREKRLGQANNLFVKVTTEHRDLWLNWYGLAQVQAAMGDRAGARKSLETALGLATRPDAKGGMRRMLERLDAGQTIGN